MRRTIAVLAAVAAGWMQGCAGCGTPEVAVDEVPTIGSVENHMVRCGCQIGWDDLTCTFAGDYGIPADICNPNPRSFTIDLCVPADLNTALGATVTQAQFDEGVRLFCQDRVTSTLSAFIGAISGDQGCGHFEIACGPVAINSSGVAVDVNPACDKPCASIPCVTSGDGTNCDLNTLFGAPGGVDPTACSCTQTTGCEATTEGVCQPMSTVVDPPDIRTGVLTEALSQPTVVRMRESESSLTANVQVEACDPTGTLCATFSDTRTTSVRGSLTLYGRPCPGEACEVRVGIVAYPQDLAFEFGCLGAVCLGSANLSQMAVVAGTGDGVASVDAAGNAVIPAGALRFVADGVRDGSRFRITSTNPHPVGFRVDFAAKTFTIPALALTLSGGSTATLQVVGDLENQPPRAAAGPAQLLECTSPDGAVAHLDATGTSDPDGDQIAYTWWRGAPFDAGRLVEHGLAVDAVASLGTTRFLFTVSDSRLATDGSATEVTVQDTTPPVLEVSVDAPCLWPPNHELVLYRLGESLTAIATDVCDPSPRVRIVSVSSDQPALGGGSGNAAPDVLAGTAAFCVRAERAGTLREGRTYTAVVEAADASGNLTTRPVTIRVPHDMRGGGPKQCPKVDPARIVGEGDPRCLEDVPAPEEPGAAAASATAAGSAFAGPASAGCGSAGPDTGGLLLLLLAAIRARRRTVR